MPDAPNDEFAGVHPADRAGQARFNEKADTATKGCLGELVGCLPALGLIALLVPSLAWL